MKKQIGLMVVGALALSVAHTQAETVTATVSSGAKTPIASFGVYDVDSCASGGKPKITFYQPEHGTISSTWSRVKFEDGHKCKGKPLNGLVIYYQAKRGYRGKDTGSYVVSFPEFNTGSGFKAYKYKADITVR